MKAMDLVAWMNEQNSRRKAHATVALATSLVLVGEAVRLELTILGLTLFAGLSLHVLAEFWIAIMEGEGPQFARV